MPPEISQTGILGEADRARLWYKVSDLLNTSWDHRNRLDDKGMNYLEDQLKRNLGKLELHSGSTAWVRVQGFIVAAPPHEVLELIKLVPIARLAS